MDLHYLIKEYNRTGHEQNGLRESLFNEIKCETDKYPRDYVGLVIKIPAVLMYPDSLTYTPSTGNLIKWYKILINHKVDEKAMRQIVRRERT
jgi:hypothetical protein